MSAALTRVSLSLKNPAILKKSKHKKLDEDWFDTREPINDGMMFNAKYLGMTFVSEPKGDDITSTAVQRIINLGKGTKKQGVQLMVSSKGIKIHDQTSSKLLNDITIRRISYCAALKHHLKVFAFVAQNEKNESMECHAYLCNTIKEAQALTVTVAQSFKIAFEIDNEQTSPQATTDDAEKTKDDETESNFNIINGGKNDKKTQMIIPNVLDKKYQRLSLDSNPFDTSDQELNSPRVSTPEGAKIMKREELQSETNGLEQPDSVFVFSNSPKTPSSTTKNSNQPITPILPPPASTRQSDKPSPRRSVVRPSSVGNLSNSAVLYQSVHTPSPSQPTRDMEDWDQGFADLALSRTKEKQIPDTTKPSDTKYPPSNPFFSPGNPFT